MQAILFDWDGTLVDSLGRYYAANSVVMEHFGLPFDVERYRHHYAPDWRVQYRSLGVPEARLAEAQAIWRAHIDLGDVGLLPGAATALRALDAAGIRLGLVTATERSAAEPLLDRLDLAELLSTRVFGDDLAVHKPDPAPLRLALEQMGLGGAVDGVTYVGDAVPDMLMARAVGVAGVGVRSMLGEAGALRDAGADVVVPSVAAWVAELLGRPADAA